MGTTNYEWDFFDGTVRDLIVALRASLKEREFLIRSIDSVRDPAVLHRMVNGIVQEKSVLPGGLVIRYSDKLLDHIFQEMNGFDEIWVGDQGTDWSAFNDVPSMTSDGVAFGGNEQIEPTGSHHHDFLRVARRASVQLGVADGIGVNVIYFAGCLGGELSKYLIDPH